MSYWKPVGGLVEFDWDDEKNRINRGKHGWDFADAIRVFLDPLFHSTEDRSSDYGEQRHKVIAMPDKSW